LPGQAGRGGHGQRFVCRRSADPIETLLPLHLLGASDTIRQAVNWRKLFEKLGSLDCVPAGCYLVFKLCPIALTCGATW
jgi:hypothetical protein